MTTTTEPGQLYVGLMSGTSMDGIDAALVRLGDHRCETLATRSHPYPDPLRKRLLDLSRNPESVSVDDLGRLDTATGQCFCDAALALLAAAGPLPDAVQAIGSHGQTIRHRPQDEEGFTLQIGDPNRIAQGTGITTVADFRRRDLAAGGEGAPLAPAFHEWLLGQGGVDRVVLNLGGFANITILPAGGGPASGFDTGPANSLMDVWIRTQRGKAFDRDGQWALSGQCSERLLEKLLDDPYFARRPPKSTGFEHFGIAWLEDRLDSESYAAEDVQASLLALSIRSISSAIRSAAPATREVLACGGGVHNPALMSGLADALPGIRLGTTSDHGLDPDWVEAAAFAWLASRTLAGLPGNLPSVTGAASSEILGGVYLCAS